MAELHTTIRRAQIFRHGAEVTRSAEVTLQGGRETLRISGLSRSTDLDTVRLYSSGGLSCRNLRFTDGKEGEKDSEELQQQIALKQKEIETIELQESLWQTNGNFTNRQEVRTEEVEAYIEKLPQRLHALQQEELSLHKELAELEKKLEKAQQGEEKPILLADVEAAQPGPCLLEIRYHENSAGWQSVYEVHSDGKEDLQLRLRARVSQNSGEDWNGIELCLCTGDPAAGTVLPELMPQYLDLQEEKQFKTMAAGNARMSNAMLDMAPAPMMARAEAEEAVVEKDETLTEYELPEPKDIATGGEGTMVDLHTDVLKTEYRISTVPKLDPHAYLTAVVKTADLPLVTASEANIYLKGLYTGRIWLDPEMTKEEAVITLGREERIAVRREEMGRKTSKTLLSGQKVTEQSYLTTFSNTYDKEVTIHVSDQIPVSRNKEITVEVTEKSGMSEGENGLLSKELTLPAGGSETLRLSYKVALPKDKRLQTAYSQRTFCPECGSPVYGRFCPVCGALVK
ncbi:MAG: mucoidy inhibitor MuiA family protein [Erysipelotrichaceae bacterium]|nr:mucoidy inhibitor MuiA family protein [Erysipelotrichaceae bacterium]